MSTKTEATAKMWEVWKEKNGSAEFYAIGRNKIPILVTLTAYKEDEENALVVSKSVNNYNKQLKAIECLDDDIRKLNKHRLDLLSACRSVKEIMRDYSYNFKQNESILVSRETLNEWMETLNNAIEQATRV